MQLAACAPGRDEPLSQRWIGPSGLSLLAEEVLRRLWHRLPSVWARVRALLRLHLGPGERFRDPLLVLWSLLTAFTGCRNLCSHRWRLNRGNLRSEVGRAWLSAGHERGMLGALFGRLFASPVRLGDLAPRVLTDRDPGARCSHLLNGFWPVLAAKEATRRGVQVEPVLNRSQPVDPILLTLDKQCGIRNTFDNLELELLRPVLEPCALQLCILVATRRELGEMLPASPGESEGTSDVNAAGGDMPNDVDTAVHGGAQ